ncbi:helix-turn-helix domain-containing protein [Actinoplanes sp. NPDC051633]|uniref:TetR/AcrR family transcriptional regulator n=1 Tax=Actinoplanes sp. NPDC051633 TaxID=3155670 RepID=UPI00341908FC
MAVRLRADAERNRVALLAAARQVFSEQGLEASLDEIARRAGVGNATLYRRFPTRQDLIAAVFADRKATHVELGDRALAHPDPWQGFVGYLTGLCEMQAENRGLGELLVTVNFDGDERLTQLRTTSQRRAREVIERAQAAGALRADFDLGDLWRILMANAGVLERSHDATSWRRQLTLVLEGLSPR